MGDCKSMDNLYELVKTAQNNNDESIMLMLNKFNPLIKKYSRSLNYDGAYSDLVINLIEIIRCIPILKNESMQKEACIVAYIANSLRYKYIQLSKKYSEIYKMEVELNEQILGSKSDDNIENHILINMLLDKLPELQRKVLIEKFIKDHTDVEIANNLHISRQAVNKTKNRGLKNLKKYLTLN